MTEELLERGKRLAATKQWVFDVGAGVIGPVEEFFDGSEQVFVSPVNEQPVDAPVVKLATGHTFLLREETPIEIADREVKTYVALIQMLSDFVSASAAKASEEKVPPETFVLLLTASLKAQLHALQLVKQGPEAFA